MKYIHSTPSKKWRVCFPSGIKKPRRLGVFDTIEIAKQRRDEYLLSIGLKVSEVNETEKMSTRDLAPILDCQGHTILCLFDMHYPYQHDGALSIVKQVIKNLKPDVIVHGGDCVDFYQLSRFLQDESRSQKVQEELDAWYQGARELKSPDAQYFFLPGNHEARLYSYLCSNPQLSSLRVLKLESLLRLSELNIKLAKSLRFLDKRLVIVHGRYTSINPSSAVRKEIKMRGWQQSVIQGHGHNFGHFELSGPLYRIEGAEVGCLCQDSWYTDADLNWQRGFAVVTIEGDIFSIENIKIDNGGVCIFRGNVYRE